jgi:hypothetical protein
VRGQAPLGGQMALESLEPPLGLGVHWIS